MHSETQSPTNEAKAAVLRIVGFYPSIPASDPQVYTAGMVALLSSYPLSLIRRAADPRRGFPSLFKFVPSVAEAREVLDKWNFEESRHREAIERWSRPALAAPETSIPRQSRESYEELKAKHGENWGLGKDAAPQSASEAKASLVAQIGQAEFDALPDARLPGYWRKPRSDCAA